MLLVSVFNQFSAPYMSIIVQPCYHATSMSSTSSTKISLPTSTRETHHAAEVDKTDPELYQYFANLVSSLPSAVGIGGNQLYQHDQGWYASLPSMVGAMVADACFAARPSDVIVATPLKSGTTWIKSLLYATARREEHLPEDAAGHPFNSVPPHECIKFLEQQIYVHDRIPDLEELPDPRLFATHVPFGALPRSTVKAGRRCKVVYVCRDPKDTFVSLWDFENRFRVKDGLEPLPVETAAEMFCDGITPVGPYWDHVLGYWRAHLENPEQVLFFKYEEMHRDPSGHVRRLAEFIGRPFGAGDEDNDAVEAIVRLCSFDHMRALRVNKEGKTELVVGAVENSSFFRRGVVGDWANHLSPELARHIDEITRDKFKDSGLIF